jgi:hypothetical protein
MTKPTCHYCGEGEDKDEMRPYGPNGSWVHFCCMKADPKREQAASAEYHRQCEAAGPVHLIDGHPTGVRPFEPSKQ